MNEETMNPSTTGMTVNSQMKSNLLTSAKWMKFLCIIACIGVALLVIAAIAIIALNSSLGANMPIGPSISLLYIILIALYIYPIIKGFQFANATKAACLTDSESQLARGFAGLGSLLKYFGILTIIVLIIYVLIFIAALTMGLAITG